jgi:pentatricopeptide repeat protein
MDAARAVVEEMAAAGVRPNEVTYNSLVNGYVQSRNMDAARAVVEEMAAAGVRPNEVTYNSLVNGYAKEYPPALDEAERIHALMLVQKLCPDKYTYGALIRCGGAARRPDRSLYWFETAVTAGVRHAPPNFAMLVKAAGYRDALAACAKHKLDLDQMLADNERGKGKGGKGGKGGQGGKGSKGRKGKGGTYGGNGKGYGRCKGGFGGGHSGGGGADADRPMTSLERMTLAQGESGGRYQHRYNDRGKGGFGHRDGDRGKGGRW